MKIKKGLAVFAVFIAVLFLAGCLNYKSYPVPEESQKEQDLLSEIAEIEKELGLEDENELTGGATAETEAAAETEDELLAEIKEIEEGETKETEETEKPAEEGPQAEEVDLSNLQRLEVNENELVNLNLKVDDPDKDKVTYTFSLPSNEQGKWKTNYGDAGEYVVTLTATDGTHTTKKDILLVVNRVNVPPILKEIKDKIIKEGETVVLEPQAVDPNNDPVTLAVSEPLSTNTWTTDHTSAGEYEIIITASDGELESKETFLLTVQDVNVLPEILGLKELTVKEGETVKIRPSITDLDGDEITLTISEPVGNDGLWETSYTDHGTYPITVTADDGKDTVTRTITLTVEDVNMPPEIIEIVLG